MVLEQKKTTVAYRCPDCGTGVMSLVSLFNLSADMIKLKCTCGKSDMSIVFTRDRKVRMDVPCILCGQKHQYNLSTNVFFDKDLFVLPCSYSEMNICFIGESNNVKAELARQELDLLKLMEDNNLESMDAYHPNPLEADGTDPEIMRELIYVIEDMDEEDKIFCKCQGDDRRNRHFGMEVAYGNLNITCDKCGATKKIAVDNSLATIDFLNSDKLVLE